MTPTKTEEARINRDVARAMALSEARTLLTCLTEGWGEGGVRHCTEALAASLEEVRRTEEAYDARLTALTQGCAL